MEVFLGSIQFMKRKQQNYNMCYNNVLGGYVTLRLKYVFFQNLFKKDVILFIITM